MKYLLVFILLLLFTFNIKAQINIDSFLKNTPDSNEMKQILIRKLNLRDRLLSNADKDKFKVDRINETISKFNDYKKKVDSLTIEILFDLYSTPHPLRDSLALDLYHRNKIFIQDTLNKNIKLFSNIELNDLTIILRSPIAHIYLLDSPDWGLFYSLTKDFGSKEINDLDMSRIVLIIYYNLKYTSEQIQYMFNVLRVNAEDYTLFEKQRKEFFNTLNIIKNL